MTPYANHFSSSASLGLRIYQAYKFAIEECVLDELQIMAIVRMPRRISPIAKVIIGNNSSGMLARQFQDYCIVLDISEVVFPKAQVSEMSQGQYKS